MDAELLLGPRGSAFPRDLREDLRVWAVARDFGSRSSSCEIIRRTDRSCQVFQQPMLATKAKKPNSGFVTFISHFPFSSVMGLHPCGAPSQRKKVVCAVVKRPPTALAAKLPYLCCSSSALVRAGT